MLLLLFKEPEDMANGVYNRGYFIVGTVDMTGTTFRLMLTNTGYVFNPDHNFVGSNTSSGSNGEPIAFEISVGGYARQTLALTAFEDDTNDFAGLDSPDKTFSALVAGQTVGGAVLYRYSTSGGTTGDTGQDLVCFYDVTDTPTNGGDITIQFASTSAGGALKIASTS